MKNIEFTKNGYIKIIEAISDNYKILNFRNANKIVNSNPQKTGLCALRHDIDFCLWSALEMAQIESNMGISSSYYFLFNSENYNLLSNNAKSIVKEINGMGHEIAIHFDLSAYSSNEQEKEFNLQIQLLENIIEDKVHSVSFHNPSTYSNGIYNEERFHGLLNTYSRQFNQVFDYASDSRCHFRREDIFENIIKKQFNNLHFLIHPMWWISAANTRNDKLRDTAKKKFIFVEKYLLSGYV